MVNMIAQAGRFIQGGGIGRALDGLAGLTANPRNVDAIKTERLRVKAAENAIAEQSRQIEERGERRTARAGAINPDGTLNQAGFGNYMTIAPDEAIQIKGYFDGLDEKKRAEELTDAKEKADQQGRLAAFIASSDDPAGAYAQVYANLPEGSRQGWSPDYDPQRVDFLLAQATETDQLLKQLAEKRKGNAITAALKGAYGVQEPAPQVAPANPMEGLPTRSTAPEGYTLPGAQGGDMAARIKAGLVARGLPEHVAEGFVLNGMDESGLNPGINEANPTVAGSRGGFGLMQWTGPRRVGLEKFAASQGRPISDPETQLDYLMLELQGPESGAANLIMSTQNSGEAAAAIAKAYLRPAQEHLDRRVAKYTGGQPAQPQGQPDITAALSSLIAAGVDQGTIDMVMAQLKGPEPQSAEAKLEADIRAGLVDRPAPEPMSPEGRLQADIAAGRATAPPVEPMSPEGRLAADRAAGLIPPIGEAGSAYDYKAEEDLRQEYIGIPAVKNFALQTDAIGRVAASAQNPSAAGDLALIFSFMKVLDPTSVVRETEFANAQNAAGVPDQVRNAYNRALSGERLGDDQRADFVGRAKSLYEQAELQLRSLTDQYTTIAKARGLDPTRSIPSFDYVEPAAAPGTPAVGTVEDGHVFLGGAPDDPNNWAAVR